MAQCFSETIGSISVAALKTIHGWAKSGDVDGEMVEDAVRMAVQGTVEDVIEIDGSYYADAFPYEAELFGVKIAPSEHHGGVGGWTISHLPTLDLWLAWRADRGGIQPATILGGTNEFVESVEDICGEDLAEYARGIETTPAA